MAYELPALPYAHNALEPHIDARTMEIHHGKHHQAYVTNLNAAIEGTDLGKHSIEDLLRQLNSLSIEEAKKTAIRNNGGGHANHSLFWQIMKAGGGGEPVGELADAINAKWGSFDEFKKVFADAGMKRFGSGWAWLVVANGQLEIYSTPNQDSPYMDGKTPILGLDVWEHAYYLNYQNRRADYIAAWWNVVNWAKVNDLYKAAK